MAQTAILSLFATLSPEERVETFQLLVPLIAGVAPSGAAASGKKVVKSSGKASAAAPKAEKAPREASAWTQYVMAVRAETGLKMAEAMAEAKRRREARDPSCPLPPVASAAAAKKPTAPAKKAAASAPAPAPADAEAEEEGLEPEEAEIDGKEYYYLPAHENAAWHKEADGSQGAWAGYLNTETGEFDKSRPAPEFAEAE